jgi:PadR family transcriptional regulator PadR
MAKTNPPFMSGVPELLLLRLLDQQEMYGYELVRSIRQATGDAI